MGAQAERSQRLHIIRAFAHRQIIMALYVHKYGGTSVGTVDRIRNVAQRIAKWHRAGHQVVVVVSAMSGETNRLIALAKAVQANPDPRELDVIARPASRSPSA